MKLVDILARELKVWPNDEYESIGQANDGALHKSPNWDAGCGWSKEKYTMAEDWSRVHVTRAQWQAAVDALKAEKVVVNEVYEVVEGYVDWFESDRQFIGQRVSVHHIFRNAFGVDMAAVENKDGECLALRLELLAEIRTPEQIAAEERLHVIGNACSDIAKAVEPWNVRLDCSHAIRATVEAMIDAGYRKFEIVDN